MGMHLHDFFQRLNDRLAQDLVCVEQAVSPAQFEVTALLQHLENKKSFPVLLFEKPLNLKGASAALCPWT